MVGVSAIAAVRITTRPNTHSASLAPARFARSASTAANSVNASRCSGKNRAAPPNLPGPSQRTGRTMQYARPAMSKVSRQATTISSHAPAPRGRHWLPADNRPVFPKIGTESLLRRTPASSLTIFSASVFSVVSVVSVVRNASRTSRGECQGEPTHLFHQPGARLSELRPLTGTTRGHGFLLHKNLIRDLYNCDIQEMYKR